MSAAEVEQPFNFKRYILVFMEPKNLVLFLDGVGSYSMSERGSCFLFCI